MCRRALRRQVYKGARTMCLGCFLLAVVQSRLVRPPLVCSRRCYAGSDRARVASRRPFCPCGSQEVAFSGLWILLVLTCDLNSRDRACNGHAELCDRSYGNVTFMGSHDSFAYSDDPLARKSPKDLLTVCWAYKLHFSGPRSGSRYSDPA